MSISSLTWSRDKDGLFSAAFRNQLACASALLLATCVAGLGNPRSQQLQTQAPAAGGVAPAEPTIHLIRSICGGNGEQKGDRFVMEDPRSMFYLPEDKQVMVYFEWEGPIGQHHFEGFWKNPEGKSVVFSDFSYEAKEKRFAGYWTLPLTESMAPGVWAMEAHVDGELAGTINFQITVATRPPLPQERPVLSPAEIYKKLLPSVVSIEKLNVQHQRISLGSGFAVGENRIATTFRNVDGARTIRVTSANGAEDEISGLLAWNRREDWAILFSPIPLSAALVAAKPDSWQIGDTCYSLDSPQEGMRTILSANISGTSKFPEVGQRISLSFQLSPRASGSPVVNEYGDVIGMAASASLIPGLGSLDILSRGEFPQYPSNLSGQGLTPGFGGQLAIPAAEVMRPQSASTVTSFAEMARSGQFLPDMVKDDALLVAALGRSLDRTGPSWSIKDERFDYQRRDTTLSALVTWHAGTKLKSLASFNVYDLDNKPVDTSGPTKVNLSKGQLAYSWWTLNIAKLTPGIYRLDLVKDSAPIWRTFFRITE